MHIERHLRKFIPHFDFRSPRGLPLWQQSSLEGFYDYGIGVKVIGNTVYGLQGVSDISNVYYRPSGIFKGYPITLPKDHELLGITSIFGSPDELGVFHTDDNAVFATFRELAGDGNTKTFKLGSFKRIKQFNTALALQQRTDTWIIIPPHIRDVATRTFTASKDDTQFKDSLREKALLWKPERGEPLFIHFHHRKAGSTVPPGVIITSDRKLYILGLFGDSVRPPFVDLSTMTQHLSDNEFRKSFENLDNFALAVDTYKGSTHVAFQLDDKIYKIIIYDTSNAEQKPTLVKEKGHLINSVDSILIQDGDTVKDIKFNQTFKLQNAKNILWAQKIHYDSKGKLMSDDSGGVHIVTPEGIDAEDEMKTLHRTFTIAMSSPITPLSKDTVFHLLHTVNSWFELLFC